MKTTEKNNVKFIGKGKQIGKKTVLSFDWEVLIKIKKNEFKGKKILVVDVLPLKEKGQFGHTHTVIEHVHKEDFPDFGD
jgi:predicted lipoprotein